MSTYEEWAKENVSDDAPVIKWWVVLEGGERMGHTNSMRGWRRFEATCSCGWDSKTGGALKSAVKRDVESHKLNLHKQPEDS